MKVLIDIEAQDFVEVVLILTNIAQHLTNRIKLEHLEKAEEMRKEKEKEEYSIFKKNLPIGRIEVMDSPGETILLSPFAVEFSPGMTTTMKYLNKIKGERHGNS